LDLKKKFDIADILLKWYKENGRELPWRKTRDPYIIWLSEIILQQTRIEQGLPYFEKFVSKYSKVEDLANASEDEVLRLWQGLGYYSRARNLHFTAKEVVSKYKGEFPSEFNELKKLKGIGDYTASLIASVCFGVPEAVVDGNVFRVLSRLYGIETPINTTKAKKEFKELANQIIDKESPGDFNQAIMDFGAMVCRPANPDCNSCALKSACTAQKNSLQNELPKKLPKQKSKERFFHYFVIEKNEKVLISKRINDDIWKNLFEFPMTETKNSKYIYSEMVYEVKHKLTHQNLNIRFYKTDLIPDKSDDFKWVKVTDLEKYAFPKPIVSYIKRFLNR
jgi:A/G-specific adenine glycosylase